MVINVTDKDFEDEVLKSDSPVLVDFWAPWCGPCHIVSPVVEKLSELEKYAGKLKVCKLNVDEGHWTAMKYKVMAIPTLLLFKNGEVADTVVGVVPESVLQPKIDALL